MLPWPPTVGGLRRSTPSDGWDLVEVTSVDCPDAVFVEDAVVMFRSVAVVTRAGCVSAAEVIDVEKILDSLGCSVNRIIAAGHPRRWRRPEGRRHLYVGRGGRTNAEGIRQLRTILGPLGATVVAVPVHTVLHLKSAVTALPDGTVIGFPPVVDAPGLFPRFMAVEEESGAHVVLLGGAKLLMAADCPRTAARFSDLGYEPVIVDIGELQKLEGCVTCLSVRLRHAAAWYRVGRRPCCD